MEGLHGLNPQAQAVQEVQQIGGDSAHLAGAVISQDVVDVPQAAGIVASGSAVTGIQAFAGVSVEESQLPLWRGGRFGDGCPQNAGSQQSGGRRQSPSQEPAAMDRSGWN
jgi:hypothetical protein